MPKLQLRAEVAQPLDKPYRFIPLTQGQVTTVDVEDFDFLMNFNWQAGWCETSKTFYARRSLTGGGMELMHRTIMSAIPSEEVDHKDHDTLNNRKYNLRRCTSMQNMQNRRKTGKRLFKGVHQRESGRWRAVIRIQKKLVHLGTHDSAEDAAKAYDAAAREHFGEFAHTNFPHVIPPPPLV